MCTGDALNTSRDYSYTGKGISVSGDSGSSGLSNNSLLTNSMSMGLTGLSTGMQINSIGNQGSYAASAYRANANMLDEQAASVGQQGAWQANKLRQKGQQIAGTQTAAISANGLDVQQGSPLALLAGTAQKSEEDAQTTTYNANLKMWGLQNQANAYRSQANYIEDAASNQQIGTLLTGITKVASQYASMGG